jgi:NTP pyrophosphatase (non-canonical NTP hydrolase)
MEIKTVQNYLKDATRDMPNPFRSAAEIMTTIVEEVGEVAQEISLFEQIGTKAEWERKPSKERLAEEMTHLLNVIFTLANLYDIDLDAVYSKRIPGD